MDEAMILLFVLLSGPYWAGLLSGGALIGVEHLLMLPFRFLVMFRRYDEYAYVHDGHPSGHEGGATGARRWDDDAGMGAGWWLVGGAFMVFCMVMMVRMMAMGHSGPAEAPSTAGATRPSARSQIAAET